MKTMADIVGTRVWLRHTLLVSGDRTHRAFIDRFDAYASGGNFGLKPDLLKAWENGTHGVSRGTVRRVANELPGTEHVFALADLLSPRYLSAPGVERLMAECLVTEGRGTTRWIFSNDTVLKRAGRLPDPGDWEDPQPLAERGDFNGFLAILALFRRASARLEFRVLSRLAMALYRTLPSALRLPWVQPDVDLLLRCIEDILQLRRFYPLRPVVDWEVLRSHVLAPTYEPNPRFWVVDPATNQFTNKPQDVVVADKVRVQPRPIPFLPGVVPLQAYLDCLKSPEHKDESFPGRASLFDELPDLVENR